MNTEITLHQDRGQIHCAAMKTKKDMEQTRNLQDEMHALIARSRLLQRQAEAAPLHQRDALLLQALKPLVAIEDIVTDAKQIARSIIQRAAPLNETETDYPKPWQQQKPETTTAQGATPDRS